jgi:prepilin-type N-terminal cleavage/methylation domain-containing protein
VKQNLLAQRQDGFTLLELIAALAIFLIICGAAFSLLGASQQRFKTESQLLSSFQEARLALDQIIRDSNDAGYPPPSYINATAPGANPTSAPFAWGPGYPAATCPISGGAGIPCGTPSDFDLIIETNPNPQDPGSQVQWIRYQLQGTTLLRGMAPMVPGGDPLAPTAAALVPFIQNVVNNSSAAQIAQFQINYPSMFPGGNPVPIFSYTCDTTTGPVPCPTAGAWNSPLNIRDVLVTLIVAAPAPDATTGATRIVQLSGRGRRMNPNQ